MLFCIDDGVFVYSSTSEECLHGLFVNCFFHFPVALKRRIRCICEYKIAL